MIAVTAEQVESCVEVVSSVKVTDPVGTIVSGGSGTPEAGAKNTPSSIVSRADADAEVVIARDTSHRG